MNTQGLNHQSSVQRGMSIRTPIKDLPPSFGFGSSSSPYFESPETVIQSSQALHWSPQHNSKDELRSGSSHLLPSQFPPNCFGTLASSPPDNGRIGSVSHAPIDRSSSPQPVQIRRVGKRGRPRSKFFVQSDSDQNKPAETSSRLSTPLNTRGINFAAQQQVVSSYSPQVQASVQAPPLALPLAPPLAPPQALLQAPPQVQPRNATLHRDSRTRKSPSRKSKLKRSTKHGPSIFTRTKTSNGVPLFSSRVFALACEHQSDIRSKEAAALRENLAKIGNSQCQFSTNGLGFNFSISTDGQVSIDTIKGLTAPTSPNARKLRKLRRSMSNTGNGTSLRGGMDSDSDTEDIAEENSTRTPPRFSSLGSCDAATAFAKSLARSNDRGSGFMFLFPPVSTPEKHGQLTSFIPCTPRTPRPADSFDEASFNMQMQTPPGAIYTYENSNALYATGMTPYLRDMRSAN